MHICRCRLRLQAAIGLAHDPLQRSSQDDGAVQPFISGAISKTINMPSRSTIDEIAEAYVTAWRLSLRRLQSIATAPSGRNRSIPATRPPTRLKQSRLRRHWQLRRMSSVRIGRKLRDERHSITHKFDIAGPRGLHHGRHV